MSDKKALGYVEVALQDKVATLTFYHPASNSFPNYLLQQLVEEFNRLSVNDAVNVVVLQSEAVGPGIGESLRIRSFKAIILSLILFSFFFKVNISKLIDLNVFKTSF